MKRHILMVGCVKIFFLSTLTSFLWSFIPSEYSLLLPFCFISGVQSAAATSVIPVVWSLFCFPKHHDRIVYYKTYFASRRMLITSFMVLLFFFKSRRRVQTRSSITVLTCSYCSRCAHQYLLEHIRPFPVSARSWLAFVKFVTNL